VAPSGFVFADDRGEPLQGTVVYKYHWRPMLTRLGLPAIRLYDCRHTAATVMHEAGYDMKAIQATLGHATVSITMDIYSHLSPERQRQQTRALEAYLSGTRTNQGQSEASES
jgi:integrase